QLSSITENYIVDICSPDNSRVYVITKTAAYRIDNGDSNEFATVVEITPAQSYGEFTSVKCIDSNNDYVYLITKNEGVLFSTDAGANFAKINGGLEIITCPQWKFAYDQNPQTGLTDGIKDVYCYGFKAGVFKRNLVSS